MNKTTHFGDTLAVSISFLCAIHCFALPVFITLLPSLQLLSCSKVHLWMLVAIIPTSLVSLILGCSKHKNKSYLAIAILGLSVLTFSAIWGHQLFGCKNEKYVTLLGSCILSCAHIKNFIHCRKKGRSSLSSTTCCN